MFPLCASIHLPSMQFILSYSNNLNMLKKNPEYARPDYLYLEITQYSWSKKG